jgi:predicted ATPase/DNA-binding SARP family transcriptional activator
VLPRTAAKESVKHSREPDESVRVSRLALYLLGPPRVELDGEPVHVGRSKAVALLAYLAVERRRHGRDALATLLWSEFDQRGARAELRRMLSVLNRTLGKEWLETDRATAGLGPEADLWLDVEQFRRRLAVCEAAGQPVDEACESCLPLLSEAVELYRDDFMASFTLPDAPAFDEWQRFQVQGLRDELGSALERLARCHSAGGESETAIAYAQRWLALDPLRESAHRGLMRLYAQTGRRTAALRQYRECVRVLEGELGVPPSAETTALYERIQVKRAGREEPGEPTTGKEALAPTHLHNLPPQPTPFVGREEELDQVARRLDDPACRLLTLVGPGGVGKTRLALTAAERQLTRRQTNPFPNGVFFVPLAPVSGPELLVPTIANALNIAFYSGGDAKQQLLTYLREKQLLLVLDNFEHLLSPPPVRSAPPRDAVAISPKGNEAPLSSPAAGGDAPLSSPPLGGIEGGTGLVAAILEAAPGIKILVTSREALNLQGEWFHPVGGMRYPAGDEAEDEETDVSLEGYDALALFAQSARRARPGFDLAQERQQVVRICRLVEGMPLAIEMAAAWLKALSPGQIVHELERGLDIMSSSLRGVPTRHRSMRAVFDHSWNLLSAPERAVMGALSVFRGGFQADAAAAVAGASLPTLVGLVEKSLLRRAPESRYQVHELLRQYAAEKLHADLEEEERIRDRHAGYYVAFLQARVVALKGQRQRSALREIQAEVDNARTAWDWAVERRRVAWLDQAMEGFFLFFEWRGRYQEGEVACRRATERLGEMWSGDELRLLARLLAWRSLFSGYLGHFKAVRAQAEQSLALLDRPELAEHDVRPERAFALRQMGDTAWWSDDRDQDRRTLEQSLALYRELSDRWGTATALHSLGLRAWNDGAMEPARQAYAESLAIRGALGDLKGVADTLFELCAVYWVQGHLEQAEHLARESIAIQSDPDAPVGLPGGLCNLGFALMLRGQFFEAQDAFEEAAAIANDLGVIPLYAYYASMQGRAQMHLGHYDKALARAQTATNLLPEGLWALFADAQALLGELALSGESYAGAQRWLQASFAALQDRRQRFHLGRFRAISVYAARGLGQLPQARQHLAAALRVVTDVQDFWAGLLALPAAALVLADAGEAERALQLYALASRYPFVANSHWFEDVAGKHIAAIATTLPPQVVAAAQERGRARDLWETAAELLHELRSLGWEGTPPYMEGQGLEI